MLPVCCILNANLSGVKQSSSACSNLGLQNKQIQADGALVHLWPLAVVLQTGTVECLGFSSFGVLYFSQMCFMVD